MRDYHNLTIDELVAAWVNHHDTAAFVLLEAEYSGAVSKYLKRYADGVSNATYLSRKVWVKMCLQHRRLPSASEFEAQVWAIAKQVLRDWLRQQKPQSDELLMNWLVNHIEELVDGEFKTKFQRAWSHLHAEDLALLKLKYLDDLTLEQIAQRESKAIERVRKRYRLARAHLQQFLQQEGIPVADPQAVVPATVTGDDPNGWDRQDQSPPQRTEGVYDDGNY